MAVIHSQDGMKKKGARKPLRGVNMFFFVWNISYMPVSICRLGAGATQIPLDRVLEVVCYYNMLEHQQHWENGSKGRGYEMLSNRHYLEIETTILTDIQQ